VYDAVNDIERTHAVFKVDVKAPRWASPVAAASEAAYTVLSSLDPSSAPLLDATMAQSLAAVPAGPARAAGVAVGRKVAEGILSWRAKDGSAAVVPYVPGTAPGQWRPTPPDHTVAWGPEWGQVAPFAIASTSAFLPPPPPALTSAAYAAALNQVQSLGAQNSTTRTPDETQAAIFWSYDWPSTGTPPVFYNQIVETIALQQQNTLAQDARLFGLVNVAMGDAAIVAWNAKYIYNFWRPITAIRLADTDGNPATAADPTWTPLGSLGAPGQPSYTPPFPAYVSGHATFGGAVFTVLANFYGTDRIPFTIGSGMMPGITRSFNSFSAAALENAWSRVWLGVHFAFDATEGLATGDAVGQAVFDRIMAPSSHGR
jgi:membrane-associated phospholipid phosphatase